VVFQGFEVSEVSEVSEVPGVQRSGFRVRRFAFQALLIKASAKVRFQEFQGFKVSEVPEVPGVSRSGFSVKRSFAFSSLPPAACCPIASSSLHLFIP